MQGSSSDFLDAHFSSTLNQNLVKYLSSKFQTRVAFTCYRLDSHFHLPFIITDNTCSPAKMATCAKCHSECVIELDPDDFDEATSSAVGGTSSTVPDDLNLQCGCHFHWYVDSHLSPSCGSHVTWSSWTLPSVNVHLEVA